MSFYTSKTSGKLKNFRVSIKETDQTTLSNKTYDGIALQTVFYSNYTAVVGENQLKFFQNFSWSGTKNLLIEFSFDLSEGAELELFGESTNTGTAMISRSAGAMNFSASGFLGIDHPDFDQTYKSVAFSCWIKSDPAFIPAQNSTLFEGMDSSNQRQVNAHVPWSDRSVYWDCGNDGTGYDRISRQGLTADYGPTLKHWVFTKDANTGKMAIFKDGANFTQGNAKVKSIHFNDLTLGRAYNENIWYYGQVENFQFWDTTFTAAMAKSVMDGDEAILAELSAREKFNIKATRNNITDISNHPTTIKNNGIVGRSNTFGFDLVRGFSTIQRPKISLVRGQYTTSTVNTTIVHDTLYKTPATMITYNIVNNQPVGVDTSLTYSDTQGVIRNESGDTVGLVNFTLSKSVNISTLNYYQLFPQRLELMSFVTPYGINLDMGPQGKMWEFDVSDFEPVLRGKKYLSMDFGGQFQEEIDIRFLFIKGTPARTAFSIQQIWKVDQRSYGDISAQRSYEPRTIKLPTNLSSAKVRSVISGHGQEGEFIPQIHKLDLNNGAKSESWEVWKQCEQNPVYPQGGTWLEDRAGWCPGMATDLHQMELGTLAVPNQNVNFKYSLTAAGGDSRYIANHQLVTYGAANFSNDVAITRINKPSSAIEFARINPACSTPEITIKNNGSTTLTEINIEYWTGNNTHLTHKWTGSLKFLEETTVQLPITDLAFWSATDMVFHAKLASDQYSYNDELQSAYNLPAVHGNKISLIYRTNLYPQENSYKITDITGNVVASKGGFTASRQYNDTLALAEGCYKFEFLDNGDDGLYYWYYDAAGQTHGTGFLKLKDLVKGTTKTFEPEFGKSTIYEFSVSNSVGISEQTLNDQLNIFPNPTSSRIINIYSAKGLDGAGISIMDAMGKVMTVSSTIHGYAAELNLQQLPAGVYFVRVQMDGELSIRKIVLL